MTRTKIAAGLAALTLAAAGCVPPPDRGDTDRTTTARTTTSAEVTPAAVPEPRTQTTETLPDDRVIETHHRPEPTRQDSQEQVFRDTTCELLDDGYTVQEVMLGSVMTDKPFTDERAGELIAEGIMQQCPQYIPDMLAFLDDMGY